MSSIRCCCTQWHVSKNTSSTSSACAHSSIRSTSTSSDEEVFNFHWTSRTYSKSAVGLPHMIIISICSKFRSSRCRNRCWRRWSRYNWRCCRNGHSISRLIKSRSKRGVWISYVFNAHNYVISVSPLTIKFTADPIPVPPASGASIATDNESVDVNTIGYVDSKNVVSFAAKSRVKNLFVVCP